MINYRQTKIICTIGPASSSPEVLKSMIKNGMNVARLNFSHGTHEEHLAKINTIRQVAKEMNATVAILLDTKGPEIRTHNFTNGQVKVEKKSTIKIYMKEMLGTSTEFSVTYTNLINDVKVGGKILVDDGSLILDIKDINYEEGYIECIAKNEAILKDKRGVNVPGSNLNMPFISKQDLSDIEFGCEVGVDYIATSFTRRPDDVLDVRKILNKHHADIGIIAKIENTEGVSNIESILEVADGLMVARGDLGVEIPLYDVPVIQRKMIKAGLQKNKPVVVATQMLDSMQYKPMPTRAEVSDVANAILTGTDCIMLSGETASGLYPVEAVKTMSKIACRIEKELDHPKFFNYALKYQPKSISNSICLSVVDITNQLDIKAIICPTMHGTVCKKVSNFRPGVPVIAVTHDEAVMRKLCVYSCIHPVLMEDLKDNTEDVIREATKIAKEKFELQTGDTCVITCSSPVDMSSNRVHANMLRIEIIE